MSLAEAGSEQDRAVADVLRKLAIAWTEFEGRLEATPIVRKLMRGRFELDDYRAFLINLRQQVKDGALWMSRAASSIGEDHLELRSTLMQHAVTEHRDFRLLEADYVATGGALAAIQSAPKNIGSEALSAWMFHEASRPNPFGLLGAMFIIEGLGSIKAAEWGRLIQSRLGLPGDAVKFLLYHGENDAEHMQEFEAMLRLVLPGEDTAARIVTCARVTGRLYALQIEEIARVKRDIRSFDLADFDPKDPDPWLALYLDQSLPIDEAAKQALLVGNRSVSRRWLFPVARPLIFAFFIVVKIARAISPRRPNMNHALHQLIYWGLKNFASPEANMLILRHFTLATELLAFIKGNAGPVEIDSWPLRPTRLEDLRDNVFLQHDLNIYNFIIQLNASLRAQGRDLAPVAKPDFSMVSDEPIRLDPLPRGKLNVVDAQTAVEAYTPLYALFLPREDFVRAANSLQLDEVVAIYIAKILGTDWHLAFMKNGHPLVPLSTLQAGYRLMMHGLDVEGLHGWLRILKRRQAAGLPLDPRDPTASAVA